MIDNIKKGEIDFLNFVNSPKGEITALVETAKKEMGGFSISSAENRLDDFVSAAEKHIEDGAFSSVEYWRSLTSKFARDSYNPQSQSIEGFTRQIGNSLLKNYGLIDSDLNQKSGFKASIYSNGKTTIVAFAGTENTTDWIHNFLQGLGAPSEQYESADRIARKIKDKIINNSDLKNQKLIFTGQSLGGGLAATAGAVTGDQTVTFNASGVNSKTLKSFGIAKASFLNITNHVTRGDILTKVQEENRLFPKALGKFVYHGSVLNEINLPDITTTSLFTETLLKTPQVIRGIKFHRTY